MVDAVYEIIWIESERGFGQKEFKRSYHETLAEANKAIEKHWKEEEEINPGGHVPDWYIKPGAPKLVEKP